MACPFGAAGKPSSTDRLNMGIFFKKSNEKLLVLVLFASIWIISFEASNNQGVETPARAVPIPTRVGSAFTIFSDS